MTKQVDLSGKVVTKNGKVIYLNKTTLIDKKWDVISETGLHFYVPITDEPPKVNCVEFTYQCPENSSFKFIKIYNK